jgi:hypothetical protein
MPGFPESLHQEQNLPLSPVHFEPRIDMQNVHAYP